MPFGPPIPGAPWNQPATETWNTPAVASPIYAECRTGPPIAGAPWVHQGFVTAEQFRGQPPPAPGTSGGSTVPTKPFLPRVPDPTDVRRLARLSEALSVIVNSLIGQGILVQTGPAEWQVMVGAALSSSGSGGLTGTFSTEGTYAA